MVVPWPPGGSNDIAARVLAPWLTKSFGYSVVVDNRVGASGIIGSDMVAKASPDGYTIMLNSATHVANATIYPKLPYDTLRDFTSVSPVAVVPTIMVVHPSLSAGSITEFIALAKKKPGSINFGSGGAGGQTHLPTVLFARMADINIMHVPYKGGAPAIVALISGEIQLMSATMPSVIEHIKAGRLRALGVTSTRRSLLLPDLPTVAESGLPGYEMSSWLGIFGPKLMTTSLVARLHGEIQRVLKVPEVRTSFAAQGMEPSFSEQREFAAFVEAEVKKYAVLIKEFVPTGS